MAKPPLGRQIWIIRRRSYISNRRCSLRIAVGKQNTPDNITVLYFHLLADVFIFYICFGRRWHLNHFHLPSSGGYRYKVVSCLLAERFPFSKRFGSYGGSNSNWTSLLWLTQRGTGFSQEKWKNLKIIFERPYYDIFRHYMQQLWQCRPCGAESRGPGDLLRDGHRSSFPWKTPPPVWQEEAVASICKSILKRIQNTISFLLTITIYCGRVPL